MLGLGLGVPMPTGVGATMDGPFSPLDLSPVLWLDASDTSTITAADGAWLDGTGLVLPGLSGNYASTPDSAALSITGDIDIKVKVALDDWTPSEDKVIVSKQDNTSLRSYFFGIAPTGAITLITSPDNTSTVAGSSIATGFADGSTHWIRATLDVDNGSSQRVYKFYTSSDGTTWTQLGTTSTVAGTTSISDNASILTIGGRGNPANSNIVSGTVYRTIIQDAFDTADNTTNVVFDADFAAEAAGTLSFTEDSTNAATVTLTTTYGQVSQWDDKSGSGYNVVQATAANQPKSGTRTLNSLNVVDADGTDRMDNTTLPSSAQPNTIFVVAKQDTDTNGAIFDGNASASTRNMVYESGSNWQLFAGSAASTSISSDFNVHIFTARYDNTSSWLRVDGSQSADVSPGTQPLQGFRIFDDQSLGNAMDGFIAEVIICDEVLSADQIAATESYLADKWGITL